MKIEQDWMRYDRRLMCTWKQAVSFFQVQAELNVARVHLWTSSSLAVWIGWTVRIVLSLLAGYEKVEITRK